MVDSNNETIKKKKIVVKKKSNTDSSSKDTSYNEDEFDELNIKPKSRVRRKANSPIAEEKAFVVDEFDKDEPVEDKIPIEAKRTNNVDLTTKLKNFRNNRKRRNIEIEKEVPKTINDIIEEPEAEPKPKSEPTKSKPEPKKETAKAEIKEEIKKGTKKETKKETKKQVKEETEVKKAKVSSSKKVKTQKEDEKPKTKKDLDVEKKELEKAKKASKPEKVERAKKEKLPDILFTPNPKAKSLKKDEQVEKDIKKPAQKTTEAKKKKTKKVVKAKKIEIDDSNNDNKAKRVLKPKVSRVFTILSDILYWIIFIFIVVLLFIVCVQRFSNNELSIGGIRIYNVSTESMASKYAVGDIILAKDVDPSTLRIGDDIAYNGKGDQLEGKIITHEIQSIAKNDDNSYTIITKGIENDIEDPAINSSQIKGKIIRRLPILSTISRVASNNFGLFFAIFIPVAVIIFINMIRIMNATDEEE